MRPYGRCRRPFTVKPHRQRHTHTQRHTHPAQTRWHKLGFLTGWLWIGAPICRQPVTKLLGPPWDILTVVHFLSISFGGSPWHLWDVIWEPFPSILGLFWAFGGQLAKPKGQLAKPQGQLAKPKAQLAKPKAQLAHFGRFLGSLLGPCWDQFSALDPFRKLLQSILDEFLA